jgi:hypothetical protein
MAEALSGDLRRRVLDAVEAITPGDCRAFFTAVGHEPE